MKGRYNLMIYVGIDIAKLNHFASAISSDGQELMKPFKFTNDGDGFQMLNSRLTWTFDTLFEDPSCRRQWWSFSHQLLQRAWWATSRSRDNSVSAIVFDMPITIVPVCITASALKVSVMEFCWFVSEISAKVTAGCFLTKIWQQEIPFLH